MLDNLWSDLVLEKLEVVTEQFLDSALCIDIVFLVGPHSLREKEIDPLRRIHLIDFVTTNRTFEKLVSNLTDARY